MAVLKFKKDGQWYELGEDTPESLAGASYDVSATPDDKVTLYLLTNGDGTLTALLAGKGDTENMEKDSHPWREYINAITAIVVGKGVTSIGERLFQRHEAVKSLVFEDSGSIKHLRRLAFQGCQMVGEYSFPNLEDTELAQVFSHCPNLEGITLNSNVDSVATSALSSCLNLRYVNGLIKVREVGLGAFAYTPKLENLDFDPKEDPSFLQSSFRISGAMRYANHGIWGDAEFLSGSVPIESFTAEQLENLRREPLPTIPEKNVNADGQYQYTDILYAKRTENGQTQHATISADGCRALSFYHLYNATHEKKYADFRSWWNEVMLPAYAQNPIDGIANIYDHDVNDMERVMRETLGWTVAENASMKVQDNPVLAKEAIAAELAAGRAVIADLSFHISADALYGHVVTIIGSNAVADKLIVADSIRISGNKGNVYEVAFEQLFGNFANERIWSYDTNGGDG